MYIYLHVLNLPKNILLLKIKIENLIDERTKKTKHNFKN